MYQNEDFKEFGNINEGALVLKLPGTNIKMLYAKGIGYVNARGNVGHMALSLTDFVAEEAGEARGMMGAMGRQMALMINHPQ